MNISQAGRTELNLIKKEVETLGDAINREELDRKAELSRLRLEVECLKKLLAQLKPSFEREYEEIYEDLRQNFDPEFQRKSA